MHTAYSKLQASPIEYGGCACSYEKSKASWISIHLTHDAIVYCDPSWNGLKGNQKEQTWTHGNIGQESKLNY